MKYFFLGSIILLVVSCNIVVEKQRNEYVVPKFLQDTTIGDVTTKYIRNTDSTVVLQIIKGNDTITSSEEYYINSLEKIPYCYFYKIKWSDTKVVVLTRGCNSPPDVESIVIIFGENTNTVSKYGYIRDYTNGFIIHSEDYSANNLLVENIFKKQIIDTMNSTIYYNQKMK